MNSKVLIAIVVGFGLMVPRWARKPEVDLNRLQGEVLQFDQVLGTVINQKQTKLWTMVTSDSKKTFANGQFDPALTADQDETYFYDLYFGWANDRYYRVLDCAGTEPSIR